MPLSIWSTTRSRSLSLDSSKIGSTISMPPLPTWPLMSQEKNYSLQACSLASLPKVGNLDLISPAWIIWPSIANIKFGLKAEEKCHTSMVIMSSRPTSQEWLKIYHSMPLSVSSTSTISPLVLEWLPEEHFRLSNSSQLLLLFSIKLTLEST